LKGFKKDCGGLVKRVEEFVMPSFKLTNNQVEEIPAVSIPPSDLFKQLSLMMDKKLHAAQTAAGKMFARMNSEIDPLKGKKPVDASYSSDPSSVTPAPTSEQFYGMPPNSFVGQTPPPSSVYTAPVLVTGPTG